MKDHIWAGREQGARVLQDCWLFIAPSKQMSLMTRRRGNWLAFQILKLCFYHLAYFERKHFVPRMYGITLVWHKFNWGTWICYYNCNYTIIRNIMCHWLSELYARKTDLLEKVFKEQSHQANANSERYQDCNVEIHVIFNGFLPFTRSV